MPTASDSNPPDPISSGDPDADFLLIFVSRLKKHRLQKKITLREMEKRMNVTHAYLSKVERGAAQPGMVVLMRWCRALDLHFMDVWKQASGEE